MKRVVFHRKDFFANYFWSIKDGSEIREDILAKTYLSGYFTFGDIVTLYFLIGREQLLEYASQLGIKTRIETLIKLIEEN